ncbi:hypothetical protein DFQ28_007761 [Apophysomyces sp. BC1034]|nr:hypothetical protein DFQ29_006426 [Apophysomyces sp. BC1021]KAG0186453.1 hypothetical protein DFQ28_007761 [Apophysomyces sp. BC1034]
MSTNYFLTIEPSKWQLKDAVDNIERDNPGQKLRTTLGLIKKFLVEVTEQGDDAQIAAAFLLLQRWKKIKKCLKEGNQSASTVISTDVYINAQSGSNVTVYNQQADPRTQLSAQDATSGSNRQTDPSTQDAESDITTLSWNSRENKRRKLKHVYLSAYYEADSSDTASQNWIVNGIEVPDLLRSYRLKSVHGAQHRKQLCPARVL